MIVNGKELPRVKLNRKPDGRRNGYTLTVDGVSLPNVLSISYRAGADMLPIVTVEMVADFYQDETPMEPVEDYAPWRDRGDDEEE